MKRTTAIAVISLYAVMLLAVAALTPAYAQELTEADITFDSACGASGVGRQWSDRGDRKRGDIHAREGQPGIRVGPKPNGWWSVCTMPPPPKDCPTQRIESWRGKDGWGYCEAAKHSVLRGSSVGIRRSVQTAPNTTTGRGSQTYECTRQPDGTAAWVFVRGYCSPR